MAIVNLNQQCPRSTHLERLAISRIDVMAWILIDRLLDACPVLQYLNLRSKQITNLPGDINMRSEQKQHYLFSLTIFSDSVDEFVSVLFR